MLVNVAPQGLAIPLPIPKELSRTVDATALGAFNRCPRLYDLSMRQHWHGKGSESPPLAYGTLWHVIMERHNLTDGDYNTVVMEASVAWETCKHDHMDDYRTLQRALLVYKDYLKKYGKPSDNKNEVTVGAPDNMLIEIPVNVADPELIYPYAGRIDRIFREGSQYYVEDHKTSSRMEKGWRYKYELSQQMMGYTWLASKLIGEPVAGVRINLVVTRKNDHEFDRATVTFSPQRIKEWVDNTNATYADLLHAYQTDNFRGNYTDGGCAGKYGMCGFASVCKLRPELRLLQLQQEYQIREWDPLSSAAEMPSD